MKNKNFTIKLLPTAPVIIFLTFFFAKIYDKTSLKIDYMTYENDASLKGEFILYLNFLI